jgi:hypothetical protein
MSDMELGEQRQQGKSSTEKDLANGGWIDSILDPFFRAALANRVRQSGCYIK